MSKRLWKKMADGVGRQGEICFSCVCEKLHHWDWDDRKRSGLIRQVIFGAMGQRRIRGFMWVAEESEEQRVRNVGLHQFRSKQE